MPAPRQPSLRPHPALALPACTHGQAWSEGGYSDDLTVASRCTEQGLTIYCPGYAIFPQWCAHCACCGRTPLRAARAPLQGRARERRRAAHPHQPSHGPEAPLPPAPLPARLDGCYPPRRWWNYLRRQLYVMDTYSNAHNRWGACRSMVCRPTALAGTAAAGPAWPSRWAYPSAPVHLPALLHPARPPQAHQPRARRLPCLCIMGRRAAGCRRCVVCAAGRMVELTQPRRGSADEPPHPHAPCRVPHAPPPPPPCRAVLLRLLLWALAAALLPTQHVYGGPAGSSYLWLRVFGLAPVRPWSLASLAVFSLSLAYLAAALRWMTRECRGEEPACAAVQAVAGRARLHPP